MRTAIHPNIAQKADNPEVFVEGDAPETLTRLGVKKVAFLVKNVAQLNNQAQVLEVFGGTCLSTAVIRKRLSKNNLLVSVDLHYGSGWRYSVADNYRVACETLELKTHRLPTFVAAHAGRLPFTARSFDVVIAPDPPRSLRFINSGAGRESELPTDAQQNLFRSTSEEAFRVLRYEGVFVATIPRSWLSLIHAEFETKTISVNSKRLNFKDAGDPVVYVRCKKA